nr:MAG TPA: Endonuclease [Caudoviricetes sp.]
MTAEFDEAWLRAYQARTGCGAREYGRGSLPQSPTATAPPSGGAKECRPAAEGEKPRPKYGNRKTQVDGITFDSKHESEVYAGLKLRQRAGDIAAMAMQVRFRLGERIEYVADFVVIDAAGAHVIDAKSEATRRDKVYRIKKKLMREKWGIEIEEV